MITKFFHKSPERQSLLTHLRWGELTHALIIPCTLEGTGNEVVVVYEFAEIIY